MSHSIFAFGARSRLVSLGCAFSLFAVACDSKPEPAPTKPATTQAPQSLAAPPPPPPPPPPPVTAEPEASASAAPSADAKSAAKPALGGPSPCSRCDLGKSSGALNSALNAAAGQARSCYNKALQKDSGAGGKMTVSVRIGPSGQVCGASIANDTTGGSIAGCVLGRFQGKSFQAPEQGCVTVNIPLSFQAKE